MGIPKFYRWVSERYACLSEVVQEHQIPEFDNLYFDMNGIIHTCSHPNDDDPHFRITEEQIFQDIFHYIEFLFRIIRPRKVFFMAVDGVAPRAKMNQQRGRRFMSAFTALQLAEQAKKKGEVLPTEERFDSNCITPGTVFMTKLHEQLKYFVRMKITTDENWRGIKIYLSGHDVPGEGEHKIMDFIRYSRSQSDYDSNTRHCLYGLDADLIMLGMCSHEPHFALLREEIKFVRPTKNQKGRTANPDQTKFHLLHLSLFREYLDMEFSVLKDKISFGFDLERIIDDWVLMGFLVGNDFIPHLPHLHIHEAALPRLYDAYCSVLPTLDGYINESGHLNLVRFEKFMEALAQFDRDHFGEEYEDLKWLDGKSHAEANMKDIRVLEPFKFKGKNKKMSFKPGKNIINELELDDSDVEDGPDEEIEGLDALDASMSDELKNLIKRSAAEILVKPLSEIETVCSATIENEKPTDKSSNEEINHESDPATDVVAVEDSSDDSDDNSAKNVDPNLVNVYLDDLDNDNEWTPNMEKEFKQHKKNYYKEKLDYAKVTKEVLHEQAVKYITAIQWNLHYYYDGCCSWSWYYPHHYSPYLSDVKGFSGLDLKFNLGEPFLPFQQLLAVLPAASRQLLPTAYQDLMTKNESPVIDFYPPDFETDLNGKKNDWEAVVLIPFIDEKRLLSAMEPCAKSLTEEEKQRNSHGSHLLFTTSNEPLGVYPSSIPNVFPDIKNNLAICQEIKKDAFRLEREKIVRGLLPGVRMDVYFPGFPTFKHVPFSHELKRIDVKVFQANSKNESIVLKLKDRPDLNVDLNELAQRLVGKEIYVHWPHLSPGLVTAVVTKDLKFNFEMGRTGEKQIKQSSTTIGEKRQFDKDEDVIDKRYFQNRAVEIGEIKTLVHVKPLLGRKFICNSQGQVTFEKQWAERPSSVALQTIVENINVHDTSFHQFQTLEELYPAGADVFLLGNPFYGHRGVVQSSELKNKKVHVKLEVPIEPDFTQLFEKEYKIKMYWYPGSRAAEKLGVSVHFLSRITGTVYMEESRTNAENSPASSSNHTKKDDSLNGRNNRPNRYHIGLNLKFNKKNEEVPDYTKKDSDGVWWYSSNVLRILEEYGNKFREIFDYMHTVSRHDDIFYADEIWPEDSKTKLKLLSDYLKSLPCHNALHQVVGTDTVDERMIRALEAEVERLNKSNVKAKSKTVAVNPKVLFRPTLSSGNVAPDTSVDYQLYDRVVNVRAGFTVPLGLRGTVIGIHTGQSENDMKLDVIFDEEFVGGLLLRGTKRNGYRIPAFALINISFGSRLETVKQQVKQRQQKRDTKNVDTKNTSTKKTFTPTTVALPVGQNYDPLQFVKQVANASLASNDSNSWVPKHLPPNPLLQNLTSTNQANNTASWVPLQPPPMPPSLQPPSNNIVIERKFNPTEFVTKFAQPACLIPPRTVESLPVDPHSAFTQVQAGSRPQNVQPNVSYGIYDASKKEDREHVWNQLMAQNKPISSEQLFANRPPPPSLTDVPPMHVPRAIRRTTEWVNSNFSPYQAQPFNQGLPPPPMPPMFFSQHVPQMPMFFPQNANPMQAVQQQHQAIQQQQQAAAEAFRKNLNNVNSHNLFVPLQVTKKQPAPAYVKSAGSKQKENNFETNKNDTTLINSSVTATSELVDNQVYKNSISASASKELSLKNSPNAEHESSVRPKSAINRRSRLATKFGN